MQRVGILFALVALVGCGEFDRVMVKGSGKVADQPRQVQPFEAVRIEGAANVDVKVGAGQTVVVRTDDNIQPIVKTFTEGKTLVVKTEKAFRATDGVRVSVTVPRLASLKIMGAGKASLSGLRGQSFEVEVKGAGDVDAQGNVDSLDASVAGAGNMRLENLAARKVEASIAGAGEIKVNASETLKATISGAGKIRYRGTPRMLGNNISGAGSIEPLR